MAQFFDDGQAVCELGAGVEVVEPELIKGEDAGDVGVLLSTAVSFHDRSPRSLQEAGSTSCPLPLNFNRSFVILRSFGIPA